MDKRLPIWFRHRLEKIMAHNGYDKDMTTTETCNKVGEKGQWTPVDLVLREYYNNGGGSSMGFLGITTKDCIRCYEFIKEHQELLQELDMYNEIGKSNWGFTLWTNYQVH